MRIISKIKKGALIFTAITAAAFMFTGCGNTNENSKSSENQLKNIETLKIMISPYQDADTLLKGMEPLQSMIKEKMYSKGYDIKNVDITVGTSYSAVGEALGAGSCDVGFISGGTYVTYEDDCDVLLTALREGINKDSVNASDWNTGSSENFTGSLTSYYRSVILAGPSEKGRELQKKVNNKEKLTWDDLNNVSWAVMGASSASGYMYPSLWLKNEYGKQISDLKSAVQSDSYTTSMARLASGQVDVVVGYAHIRAKFADTWESKLGGTGNIYDQTGVIAVSDKILDDTISVSKNSDIITDDLKKAFGESMIEIGETKEGLDVLNEISHKGYQWASASDYNDERSVQNMLKNK